jgi:hypothetical protein
MGDIIYSYSRAQAIEDGVLIDVTTAAREAGLKFHTAVTAAVWNEFVTVPAKATWQDESGRLWDVVWMLAYAIRQQSEPSPVLEFELHVQNDNRGPKPVKLKAVCGPGDDAEPVITVMLPEED